MSFAKQGDVGEPMQAAPYFQSEVEVGVSTTAVPTPPGESAGKASVAGKASNSGGKSKTQPAKSAGNEAALDKHGKDASEKAEVAPEGAGGNGESPAAEPVGGGEPVEIPSPSTPPAAETDPGAAARPAQQANALPEMAAMLGSVAWLMSQSPAHRHLFLTDLEWLVVPALAARQFRIFRRQGVPVAYASWAFVDEERESRLKSGEVRLAPAEWRCGDRLWLYDIVAPYGGGDEVLKELREKAFPDRAIRTVQAAPDGKGRVTVEYPPVYSGTATKPKPTQ